VERLNASLAREVEEVGITRGKIEKGREIKNL
jgi:hypothetical protein